MNKREYPSLGETIYDAVLPNGLRILVARRPGFRKCHAMFAVDYGGQERRFRVGEEWINTPAGVAHYLEHKMFDMPDGRNILSEFAARGADPNAFTSSNMTAYHFTATEGFEENLRTLLTYVTTPWYTQESVAKEQGIIAQEILAGENDPEDVGYHQILRGLYKNHPIRDGVIGTVESIRTITPQTLYACHSAFYRPSNMALCCVGDIDPETVAALAQELLPGEKAPAPVADYGEPEPETPAEPFLERTMAVAKPIFWLGSKLTVPADGLGALRERVCGELALECLAGESSALYNELYTKNLISRNFGAFVDGDAATGQLLFFGESAAPEQVRDALLERLARVAAGGLDQNAFERCRRAMYGKQLGALDRFGDYAYTMVQGCFGGWEVPDIFHILTELTAEDAAAFLCENLTAERLCLSIVRPAEK